MDKVVITEEMDTQIRKLALFDCSEGLTKPVTEDELYKKYSYIKTRVEGGSFDINWYADNVLNLHKPKMEESVIKRSHHEIRESLSAIQKAALSLIKSCLTAFKLKRTDEESKED